MTPILDWALPIALFMLALAMGCALIRLLKGPSAQDRVLALDCMYLSGMLVMLVLGLLYGSKNYFEAGLLRLPTFFERVHAPAIIATLGCWLIMHGTVLYFSVADRSLALHALLIAVFVAITVPIMSIFLMRAALFRARQMGLDVPPSLSQPKASAAPADAKDS